MTSVWVPVDNADDFIEYFKLMRKGLKKGSKNVLNVQFEDLIYNYSETIKDIEQFLNINEHIKKGKLFQPEKSINNTQLFVGNEQFREDIKKIEIELGDYLYNFPKEKVFKRDEKKVF